MVVGFGVAAGCPVPGVPRLDGSIDEPVDGADEAGARAAGVELASGAATVVVELLLAAAMPIPMPVTATALLTTASRMRLRKDRPPYLLDPSGPEAW